MKDFALETIKKHSTKDACRILREEYFISKSRAASVVRTAIKAYKSEVSDALTAAKRPFAAEDVKKSLILARANS